MNHESMNPNERKEEDDIYCNWIILKLMPDQRPMSDEDKAIALAYIKKCEEGPKAKEFKDFDKKVIAFIKYRCRGAFQSRSCDYSFVEYVLLEVRLKNRMKDYNMAQRILSYYFMQQERRKCEERWGASPRFHGKIYRKLINYHLTKANSLKDIPLYFK